jgi:hypothetical protein
MASEKYTENNSGTLQRRGFGHSLRKDFLFDEDWVNLNHGMLVPSSWPGLDVSDLAWFTTYGCVSRALRYGEEDNEGLDFVLE